MIEGHGDDIYLYPGIRMNFSSNIYGHADLNGLKAFLNARMDVIGSYPEPQPYSLERIIARKHGIPDGCVLATNGVTEAIYLIAQAYSGGHGNPYTIEHPTFSEYADACNMFGMRPAGKDDTSRKGSIAWLCNPNNPTGSVYTQEAVGEYIRHHGLVVIDQAYEDYTKARIMSPQEAVQAGNVVQLHSMTKTYAVPGLRIGYITAAEHIVREIRRYARPWTVNSLAIEAGKFLIANNRPAITDLDGYLQEAQRLKRELNSIPHIHAGETETNFMLVRIMNDTAARLKEYLAAKHGILIRDASNFDGLDCHCFRIAAQCREENDTLIAAIKKYQE